MTKDTIFSTRRHWSCLIKPMLILWLASFVLGFADHYVARHFSRAAWLVHVDKAFIALALVAFLWFVGQFLIWMIKKYLIGLETITAINGLFRRNKIVIDKSDIESIAFSNSLFEKLLRTGTVVVTTNYDTFLFSKVPKVKQFYELLIQELDD